MDYYLPTQEHHRPVTGLHDAMIDVDMNSDSVDMYGQQNSPSSKVSSTAQLLNQLNQDTLYPEEHGQHLLNKYNTFPPTKFELNGQSNLSWLNSINGIQPAHNMCDPHSVAVTSTGSPTHLQTVHNSFTAKTLSLPNSVQISGGNVSYVHMPCTTQQVFINTMSKPSIPQANRPNGFLPVQSHLAGQRPVPNSQFMMSPNGATPTSTVLDNPYPKPAYSYSCLIAMALKNSKHGSLPVAEIYNFMIRHFPYFKTAPDGWKNSVRHNLSLNKCFEKIENPNADGTNSRKGCLWALNPAKIRKMDEEILKWNKKDPAAIKRAMVHPEILEMLEKGQEAYIKLPTSVTGHHNMHVSNQGGLLLPVSPHQLPPQAIQQQMTMSPTRHPMNMSPPHHQMKMSPPHHQQHSPPPMSIANSNISPLMAQAVTSHQQTHQPMDIVTIKTEAPSMPNKYMSDGGVRQLYGENSDLALDPALSEINIQSGVWDGLPQDILDIPFSNSPTAFLISPVKDKTSPAISPGVNHRELISPTTRNLQPSGNLLTLA